MTTDTMCIEQSQLPVLRLTLLPEEQAELMIVLDNYLADLRYEIVDTDNSEFKLMLRKRQSVLIAIAHALRSPYQA